MKISSEDRKCLIIVLKLLDIYVGKDDEAVLKYMDEKRIMDLKIQYWCIKELYNSPYKVLLSKLTKEQFALKYEKTKKYLTRDNKININELIKYFVTCLQEVLQGKGKNQNVG